MRAARGIALPRVGGQRRHATVGRIDDSDERFWPSIFVNCEPGSSQKLL